MDSHFGLTPFGGQRMTHALLAAHQKSREIRQEAAVDKWQLYRWLCEGKSALGIGDRTLAVLSALLSFHPETNLSNKMALIVFPSNKQLSLRAHGMADATLRRHLGTLVDAGLIARQDSPNGKRYARRSKSGELKIAFGFSLAPLIARACEFEAMAEKVKAEKTALRELREQLTLMRRDISKLIAFGLDEQLSGPWDDLHIAFRTIVDSIPRRAEAQELTDLIASLQKIYAAIDKLLINFDKMYVMSGNESQTERQQHESKSDSKFEETTAEPKNKTIKPIASVQLKGTITLGQVLQSCPEIKTYMQTPIHNWHDLIDVSSKIRNFIGIDTKLYEMALKTLGNVNTAIIICYLLERYEHIRSTSGYLRILIGKAQDGALSLKMLMSSAASQQNGKKPQIIKDLSAHQLPSLQLSQQGVTKPIFNPM